MTEERTNPELIPLDVEDQTERVPFDFAPDRRQFVQMLVPACSSRSSAKPPWRNGPAAAAAAVAGAEDLEAVGPVM